MKKILSILFFTYFSIFPQILNGGFEQWASGEPVGWQTNNINEPKITLTPVTQTSFTHGGTSALKGEVLEIPIEGPTFTHSPILLSGTLEDPFFSYNGRPEVISGYYNFQSIGGDQFTANAFIFSGEELIAVSGFTTSSSTGSGYHELFLHLNYIDTVSTPDAIQISFQIGPAPGEMFANVGSTFYIDDFPKMTLIKPEEILQESSNERTVFIAGEVDTIKWDGGGALNINIEYSIDNGSSFQTIANNYPADSSRYFWTVPESLLTREAKIKIVESQDTSNEVKSIDFTIKPWQLTRLDGSNNLELFEPNEDGWNFDNSDNNVWPQSWWSRFDYSGTDPITNEPYPSWFPFIFAPDSTFPDWELFVDVFGQENCYLYGNSYRSEATTHWNGIWAGIASPWGGSCAGFSATSLLGFYHKSQFLSKFPNIGNFTDLYNVPINNDTQYAINYIYTHQYGQEVRAHRRSGFSKSPRELLSEIKTMFRTENGDARSLYYRNNRGSGAHSVTPYKMERINNQSSFRVRVYDSRAPGSTDGTIRIDSLSNEWTDHTGLNWLFGSSGCFLEKESADFLSRPTIPNGSITSNNNEHSLNGTSRLMVYNTSQANILYLSSAGDDIGFQDSVDFCNISDAVPIIPVIGRYHPPIGYDLPLDQYAVQLEKFSDSSSYVFFLSDSTIYNYRRFDAESNQVDILKYSESFLGIDNPDSENKNLVLETIILEDSISEKVFVTSNVNLSAGDSIKIGEKDRNELLFQNYGDSMSYDLQVRYASVNGGTNFFHMSIPMDQNSGHQVVPDWNDLQNEPVKILIDLGNDGTIDDSMFVKNQVTNIEDKGSLLSPDNYNLAQNYPNPFNPITTIKYSIPESGNVSLKVYDILGNEVASLVNEEKARGVYSVTFDASKLSSGVYFYKIKAGKFVEIKKMVLLK